MNRSERRKNINKKKIKEIEDRIKEIETVKEIEIEDMLKNQNVDMEEAVFIPPVNEKLEGEENGISAKDVIENAEEYVLDIKEQAENLKENLMERLKIDEKKRKTHERQYYNYISGNAKPHGVCFNRTLGQEYINTELYIKTICAVPYKPFSENKLKYDIPHYITLANELNKIFNYEFINSSNTSLNLVSLEKNMCEFIKSNELTTENFYYRFLKNMLLKLIFASSSHIEIAFRSKTKSSVNQLFKNIVVENIANLTNGLTDKLNQSFYEFYNMLVGTQNKYNIYTNTNPTILERISTHSIKNNDYIVEHTLANIIKTLPSSFMLNYFYAITSIYLITSMIHIYTTKNYYANKTKDEIEMELKIITACCNLTYEFKIADYFGISRVLPHSKIDISAETEYYYTYHLLNGPQFTIIKNLEEAIIILADHIVKL